MLRLLIDRNPVNLQADASVELYDTNPLFTKQGEHTYDLDIDLHDPQNALVYKYINRYDVEHVPSNREAILYNENGLILHGTEVILEVEDYSAKIQVVAGNSELNYLFGIRKQVRHLDLGKVTWPKPASSTDRTYFQNWVRQIWAGSYPQCDFAFAPFCYYNTMPHAANDIIDTSTVSNTLTEHAFLMANQFSIAYGSGSGFASATGVIPGNGTYFPMPYLASIVDKIITALGYTVGVNAIADDERYRKIVIIQRNSAAYFALMLPDWTISDFISEVEKFLNVIFDVDQATKTVNIYKVFEFYANARKITIDQKDILGNVDKDYNDNDSNQLPYNYINNNIKYSFPTVEGTTAYKYAVLDQDLIRACVIKDISNGSWSSSYFKNYGADIFKEITGDTSFLSATSIPQAFSDVYNNLILYQQTIYNEPHYFMIRSLISPADNEQGLVQLSMVNQFGERWLSDDENTETTELKIIPCMEVGSHVFYGHVPDNSVGFQMPVPYLPWPKPTFGTFGAGKYDSGENVATTTNESGMNQYIQNGYKDDEDSVPDVMTVGFYFGMMKVTWEDPVMDAEHEAIKIPVVSPANEVQMFHERLNNLTDLCWKDGRLIELGNPQLDMSIMGKNGMFYTSYCKNPGVDLTKKYTIKFRHLGRMDSRNMFLIGNKKFYCEQLKYALDNNRLSEIVEGTFYSVDENDTGGKSYYDISISLTKVSAPKGYDEQVKAGDSWSCYLELAGYGDMMDTIVLTVKMGDIDITGSAWTGIPEDESSWSTVQVVRSGNINIPNVTGDITVTAKRGKY
jgi:hypothetical protein